jgi:hypothetical protein
MSGEQPTGQDAPVVNDEATTTASATTPAETTQAQTDGAEGGEKDSPVPKTVTLTEEELQSRIERATAKAAAKAERRAFREARDMLGQQQQPRQAQQAAPDDGKPTRAQFASEDEWLDARDAWRDRQRETESRQNSEREAQRSIATKTEKLYAQAEKLPGFDRDAFDEAISTPGLHGVTVRALIASDAAAQLMAHFASNPEDVERIAKLSPERQAAELGKLEVKLQSAPKTTKAPPPVGTVNGAGSGTPSLESADFQTYKKLRAKQGARWAH